MSAQRMIAVVGPTASGKSELALRLAETMHGVIVGCDSMQIYREMDIGTAKPTREDMARAEHRMVDMLPPEQSYSCAEYAEAARKEVDDIIASGRLPIFVGGTGLYLDSLLFPRSYEISEGRGEHRAELDAIAAEEGGGERLYRMLCEVDPESAESIHPNNVRRVIRALEIYLASGRKKSELDRETAGECRYDATVIGLRYPDRALLWRRIERRVDIMLECGLIAETERLSALGVFEKNSTAAQAIGYKEMLGYVRGEVGLAEARERLIVATRRYAKRQMTWFSAKPYVKWIDISEGMGPEDIYNEAVAIISAAR